MNWQSIGEIAIAGIITAVVLYSIKAIYVVWQKGDHRSETQKSFDDMVDRDLESLNNKFQIKIEEDKPPHRVENPVFLRKTDITVSGMGASLTIEPGGSFSPKYSLSGMGAKQTIFVDNNSFINIKISGMGASAKIDKRLQRNIRDIVITGSGAEVKWK